MTPLLDALLELLARWEDAFPQQRTFSRAVRLALAQVLAPGIRTISRVIAACGLDQQDWSADYRVFSRSPWQQRKLFKPLIQEGCDYFSGLDHINLAGDFTHLAKTGRHIPNVHCMRDPMSPAFHVNLIYGLRFLQYTMLLPLYGKAEDEQELTLPTDARTIVNPPISSRPILNVQPLKSSSVTWIDGKSKLITVRKRVSLVWVMLKCAMSKACHVSPPLWSLSTQ